LNSLESDSFFFSFLSPFFSLNLLFLVIQFIQHPSD
jgi:hypothetical protein